jgi:hypothetical protein
MGHPGEKNHHTKLCYHIDRLKCKDCQRYKLAGCGGSLPSKKDVRIAPWEEVTIDIIGPWKVKVDGQLVELNVLTCIDTASNLVELIHIDHKTAKYICKKNAQSWQC